MTNQQAITLLRNLEQSLDDYCELNDEGKTAFSKAITALELFGNSEQLPSAQANTSNALESLDCIDRQAAIDAVNKALDRETLLYGFVRKVAIDAIRLLPSAQTERKKGKWIGTEFDGYADGNHVYYEWKYSACGCVIEDEEPIWNYCPNCGADMRGEQNESEKL